MCTLQRSYICHLHPQQSVEVPGSRQLITLPANYIGMEIIAFRKKFTVISSRALIVYTLYMDT